MPQTDDGYMHNKKTGDVTSTERCFQRHFRTTTSNIVMGVQGYELAEKIPDRMKYRLGKQIAAMKLESCCCIK